MPSSEMRTTLLLAALFSFRLLGLFMILPVFTLYAPEYQHSTPTLIGLAIGIYGLTQALCQLPFGFLSDRYGRKPLLYIGLILFALGGLIAALTQQLFGVVLGRALQGAGAIGSTILATVSDLTSTHYRAKAMAIIGISIGATFSLAMVLGPIIAAHFHLQGIFILSVILACLGMLITHSLPIPLLVSHPSYPSWKQVKQSMTPLILFFNFSILILHMLLTANFIALPLVLFHQLHIEKTQQWLVYLPILVLSAFFMMRLLRHKTQQSQQLTLLHFSILLITLAQIGITFFHTSLAGLLFSLLLFFIAFNTIEALLPSLVSYYAPQSIRGTALGIYSTCQFLGIFLGGVIAGYLYGQFSVTSVFLLGLSITLIWLLFPFFIAGDTHGTRHQ
ncbi:MAG: MFS transporter [Gammaproteobacteria bacterium]|nr:MFS transporter [Gammaproteobacteria bacterium]